MTDISFAELQGLTPTQRAERLRALGVSQEDYDNVWNILRSKALRGQGPFQDANSLLPWGIEYTLPSPTSTLNIAKSPPIDPTIFADSQEGMIQQLFSQGTQAVSDVSGDVREALSDGLSLEGLFDIGIANVRGAEQAMNTTIDGLGDQLNRGISTTANVIGEISGALGSQLNRGIATANTLGHMLQQPDPEATGFGNLLRSLGGGGLELVGQAGQAGQNVINWFTQPAGVQQGPPPYTEEYDRQLRGIVDQFAGAGAPQQGPQQLLNRGPNVNIPMPTQQVGAPTDLSQYFDLLNQAAPQEPDEETLGNVRRSHTRDSIAQALLMLATSPNTSTAGALAMFAGALLGGQASGEMEVQQRLDMHDQAMQRHNLLLAQGRLSEAQIAKQDADREIEIGFDNQLRQWEQDLRFQEGQRPQVIHSSGGVMVVEETDPNTGDRIVNAYDYSASRRNAGIGGALGGRMGRPSKLAEAAQVRTPTGKTGFVVDMFIQTVGDAGIAMLFGEDRLEALNEMAAEQALAAQANITDPKIRDQIFRDTRAQLLWEEAVRNPELAVAMIEYMQGLN